MTIIPSKCFHPFNINYIYHRKCSHYPLKTHEWGRNCHRGESLRLRPRASSNSRPLPRADPHPASISPAMVIVLSSLLSKVLGLAREASVASAFGLGVVTDSYGYATILPAYFLTIFGGLHGPLHSAATVVLSKRQVPPIGETVKGSPLTALWSPRSPQEAATLSKDLSGPVLRAALGFTLVVSAAAGPFLALTAPGLLGSDAHRLATLQLQIMAPTAIFAGALPAMRRWPERWPPCGSAAGLAAVETLPFRTRSASHTGLLGLAGARLHSTGRFAAASLSPMASSLTVIAAVAASGKAAPADRQGRSLWGRESPVLFLIRALGTGCCWFGGLSRIVQSHGCRRAVADPGDGHRRPVAGRSNPGKAAQGTAACGPVRVHCPAASGRGLQPDAPACSPGGSAGGQLHPRSMCCDGLRQPARSGGNR